MNEEINEILDSKITQHDRHQFEIKFDINLTPDQKYTEYKLDMYFFIPRPLNITGITYTKTDFYQDIQNYIRFKTPHIPVIKLFDTRNDVSPFNRIKSNLEKIHAVADKTAVTTYVHEAVNEMKLLGCIIKANLRDYVKCILESNPVNETLVEELVTNLLKQIIINVHNLEKLVKLPGMPTQVVDSYHFLDEFVSLTIESYITVLMQHLTENNLLPGLVDEISFMLNNEIKHRQQQGYKSILTLNSENEYYGYRKSILKKFISSILFLKIEERKEKGIHELLFGLAAGIAMFIAVMVSVFFQARYAADSFIFIFAVVTAYIFKDRIKDWLKIYFSEHMNKWLYDTKIKIMDPLKDDNTIGIFKEAFIFPMIKDVPVTVIKSRNIDNLTSVDEEGKPETIIKYGKRVKFYTKKIYESHHRLTSINDILRFNVSRFLHKAADPKYNQTFFNPETNKIESATCSKEYHINLIMLYTFSGNTGTQVKLERVRLITDRDGIKRIETPNHS
jgi:hypothetical protein